ncbi:von willebrand factor [Niveomyces insectorum RCEF 264]|uniref:von willebrand factor n=1 Tax=Niveomyces insectorum RCEF 264 TaxID=1081102 RepID=A0A167TSW0_9HYPO|nr:von willebrand factor [Niveomyces insectorum RCEF 264]
MPENQSNSGDGPHRSLFGSIKNRFGKKAATGQHSPLANPSSPIRRPFQDAPPSYSEAVSSAFAAAQVPAVAAAASAATASTGVEPRIVISSPAASNASLASSRLTADAVTTPEDPYAFLASFDTVFLIDDSGSMAGTPWREVQAVLANITPICTAHDADGIDVYFLNHRSTGSTATAVPAGKAAGGYYNVCDAATVARIFQAARPTGCTPTGGRIHSILRPYLRRYAAQLRACEDCGGPDPADTIKPVNLIVITDGVPTDELDGVLVQAARKLDAFDAPPYQVGVQFFQVGREAGAAAYLQHLDDNLAATARGGQTNGTGGGGVRDMVDTVTWDAYTRRGGGGVAGLTADGILKVVLGAVVKRLDRQPTRHGDPARPFLSVT